MKLLAYTINGQKIGMDIPVWDSTLLSGNTAFLVTEHDNDTIPSGYTDISSITNWDSFGNGAYSLDTNEPLNLSEMQVREEIKEYLTDAQLSGNTEGLTEQEIEVVQRRKLDKYYALYDYGSKTLADTIDVQSPPFDYDYNILGLHKKRIFDKGELKTVEYYGSYDFPTDTYDKLVVHEERTYYRINEMVYRREMEICWHYNNGLSGATKHTTKYYTQEESLAVGERRRRNCITNLKINAVGLIMAVSGVTQLEAEEIGWAFLSEFSDEIVMYIEGAQENLLNAIATTTNHPWLDGAPAMLGGATVRQYLYSELWIDYTENNTYV